MKKLIIISSLFLVSFATFAAVLYSGTDCCETSQACCSTMSQCCIE